MSASREKKSRQDADDSVLSQREQKHRQEAKQAKRSTILYAVVGVICVVFCAFLLIRNSGLLQRNLAAITVNGVKYTAADVQYYYNTTRNYTANLYYSQLYYVPFDTSRSLKNQVYNEETGETWYDYLMDSVQETITSNTAILAQIEAEGYTMSEEGQQSLDTLLGDLETTWISSGFASRDAYLRANFGPYITYDRYCELLTRDALVADYTASVQEGFTYSDEEYQAYYQEHADELDSITVDQFLFRAQAQTTDEEGNDLGLSEEEEAAALETAKETAKAQAEELMSRLEAGEDPQALSEEFSEEIYITSLDDTRVGANVNSSYSEWALDPARQPGDVTLAEYDAGSGVYNYYVVRFEGRTLDESPTANVRHILVAAENDEETGVPSQEQYDAAREEAQALLDEWAAGNATEESFAQLAASNSADTGSADEGGLISNISSADSYVDTFKDWALDPARQPGDTGLVQNTGSSTKGWHIMYYVSSGDPIWKQTAYTAMLNQDYSDWMATVSEGYTASTGFGMSLIEG